MAAFQNFRSALNGFNREDVVHYIEYINNKHTSQINQLQTDNQALLSELESLRNIENANRSTEAQLTEAQNRISELETELQQLRALQEAAAQRPQTDSELEAYRRAERAERIANDRVAQLYAQANGILADTTIHTDETATQVGQLTEQICAQLNVLQSTLVSGSDLIRRSAAAMYAIKPLSDHH